ncbi:MAG: NusA-like transcription termination signal-binding factor [Thermofilum sp.]|jgi:N utilization substance protein A|nr:NusA-like transcription termination signal-binding factor [Thermofilum sp.]
MNTNISRRLTNEELQLMSFFEDITRIPPKDLLFDEVFQRYIFLVERGLAPLAVGKYGHKIRLLRDLLKKDVEVVEDGATLEELTKSTLFPARVIEVKVREEGGRKIVVALVPADQVGIAIGKNGRNVQRARLILGRYYGVAEVRVQPSAST